MLLNKMVVARCLRVRMAVFLFLQYAYVDVKDVTDNEQHEK